MIVFIDIVLLAIAIIIIIHGVRRGFVSSIFGLVAWIVALVCVVKFSLPFAEWLYTDVLREGIIEKLSKTLENDYAFGTAQSQYNAFAQSISEMLNSTTGMLGLDTSSNVLSFNTEGLTVTEVAQNITDSFLSPIVIQICKWIISIVGFIILMSIFGIISNFIIKVIHATFLKSTDKILGGVVGGLKAIVMTIVFAILLNMASGMIESNNAVKALINGKENSKVSSFTTAVEESQIVKAVNDKTSF